MLEYEADIIRTERLGGSIHHLTVSAEPIAADVKPGQFVQVRVGNGSDPFLRRTFSVCNADPRAGTVELLVDVIGRGTGMLCRLDGGSPINMIGPLGTPFDLSLGGNVPCMLVAGGIGAAPLVFVARTLLHTGARRFEFIMGSRTISAQSFLDFFTADIPIWKATDDGSLGFAGTAADLLEDRLRTETPAAIFCCGPHPMMRAVARIAAANDVPCQVSLEERMACGIGACLGCAVRMANGEMRRSCVDGPVFAADEVAW